MSDNRDNQNGLMFDAEARLQDLERQKMELESRPHDGFADATRVMRLESEIAELDDAIRRERQRAQRGEG